MNSNIEIIKVDKDNIQTYGCPCFLNPKNEGHLIKLDWLKKRLSEGMTIKHLYLKEEKKPIGFIEYVPGEFAWRAVEAKNYLFIHCIWISPNKQKNKGYGSFLIEDCIKDAEKQGKLGVATISSEGSFMASKDIFLKNKFESIEEQKPFNLMIKTIKDGAKPKFKDWKSELEHYSGLHILYSNQCPWVARSIKELSDIAKKHNLKLNIKELKMPKEAQNAPSLYSTFNLIYNKKLLSDHYISARRFENIIKKEIK